LVQSTDGSAKWLTKFSDGITVETVLIKHEHRYTVCVSSQAGCALDCQFCVTGKQGWQSNLSTDQIIAQVQTAYQIRPDLTLTNVVFMGMGEPLLNEQAVVQAVQILVDDWAYGLAHTRVTISTVGIVPAILRMHKVPSALTVSLHAPDTELRRAIMPINDKFPLPILIEACKNYVAKGRDLTFAYVLLQDINDQRTHAESLIQLIQEIPCKVNLIQFNEAPTLSYKTSPNERMEAFRSQLLKAGIQTTIRYSKGSDVGAACGQLRTHLDRASIKIKQKTLAP
jgi:23S rRNA (adenine2503-C2)-methyltransferase